MSILTTEPLHVGFYSPALPDSGASNGIVTYTRIMRDALQAAGHVVTVVTPSHIEQAGRVLAIRRSNRLTRRLRVLLDKRVSRNGANAWATLHLLEAFSAARRAGVQVFEMEESFGWAGQLVGQGVPIVERLHGPHGLIRDEIEDAEEKARGDLREAAELRSFSQVNAITSPTCRLLDELRARYDLCLGAALALPNPIPPAAGSEAWRAGEANPDQLLFVGRVDRCKGADIVLKAFDRALLQRPGLTLVIVGPDSGFASRGELVHFAEFISKELRPAACERIRYLGVRSPSEISALRLQSAISLTSSRFENFPYSIAEAMAVGMPIITTATFGGSEMIRHGQDGLIVPIGDANAMATAIVALQDNREKASELGRSAMARAADWLAPARIAAETINFYREVIAGAQVRWTGEDQRL